MPRPPMLSSPSRPTRFATACSSPGTLSAAPPAPPRGRCSTGPAGGRSGAHPLPAPVSSWPAGPTGGARTYLTCPRSRSISRGWLTGATTARRAGEQAQAALTDAHHRRKERLAPLGPLAWAPDPAGPLADLENHLATARQELAAARARLAGLRADPALRGRSPHRLTAARDAWRARYEAEHQQRPAVPPEPASYPAGVPRPESERHGPRPARDVAPSLGR